MISSLWSGRAQRSFAERCRSSSCIDAPPAAASGGMWVAGGSSLEGRVSRRVFVVSFSCLRITMCVGSVKFSMFSVRFNGFGDIKARMLQLAGGLRNLELRCLVHFYFGDAYIVLPVDQTHSRQLPYTFHRPTPRKAAPKWPQLLASIHLSLSHLILEMSPKSSA